MLPRVMPAIDLIFDSVSDFGFRGVDPVVHRLVEIASEHRTGVKHRVPARSGDTAADRAAAPPRSAPWQPASAWSLWTRTPRFPLRDDVQRMPLQRRYPGAFGTSGYRSPFHNRLTSLLKSLQSFVCFVFPEIQRRGTTALRSRVQIRSRACPHRSSRRDRAPSAQPLLWPRECGAGRAA